MAPILREFGPGIWISEGPVVSILWFSLSDPHGGDQVVDRRPVRVVAHRAFPGAQDTRSMRWGRFAAWSRPTCLHHLSLGEWKTAYPDARLFAPPGLRRRRKDLAFDADLGDAPDPLWAADIDQVLVRGSFAMTEAVFFHRASGAVIFADLIENLPRDWFKGWRAPPGAARRDRRAPSRRAARMARQLCRSAARRGPRSSAFSPGRSSAR